jgi:hypothetical protein
MDATRLASLFQNLPMPAEIFIKCFTKTRPHAWGFEEKFLS